MIRNALFPAKLGFAIGLASVFVAGSAQAGVYQTDFHRQIHENLGDESRYDSVGSLITSGPNGSGVCSAVLINRRWALTAAHCVDAGTDSLNFNFGGQNVSGREWYAHRDWFNRDPEDPGGLYTPQLGLGGDIALVRLDQKVTAVRPTKIYNGSVVGQVATSVGFGSFGNATTGNINPAGQIRHAGENVVDEFINRGQGRRRVFVMDMDDEPLRNIFPGQEITTDDFPLALEYAIAPGDSGGGTFIGNRLVGIHSFATQNADGLVPFGAEVGLEHVPAYRRWIRTIQRKVFNGERIFVGAGSPSSPITFRQDIDEAAVATSNGQTLFLGTAVAPIAAVPEPASAALLGLAGSLLLPRRRRG